MSLVVFLGPTLRVEDARAEFDAIYLPPVAQGDLYRAARQKPFAIGIIDGYFERLPAVWHKEILWALSQGVHVFGAASMGALRAAELGRYGMRGIGSIYQAFARGELADDDEVTIAHGEADTGYRQLSEAMVNIRATLRALVGQGLVSEAVSQRFIAVAKGMFYPDRSYPSLCREARRQGISAGDVEALQGFVASERVDQKRLDALELLVALRECEAQATPPPQVAFSLAYTEAWDRVVAWSEAQAPLF
jgi:hypothetical protein